MFLSENPKRMDKRAEEYHREFIAYLQKYVHPYQYPP